MREVDAKEKQAALEEEARLNEERQKREEENRRAYEEKLRREKVELIKLKEGVISEDDIPREKPEEKHYSLWQKISNFIYHEKGYILFGLCFAALVIFIVWSIATADRPDMTVMFLATDDNMEYLCEDAAKILEPYCEDVNENGEIMLKMYYVPEELNSSNPAAMQMNQSYRTKITAEFQSGDVIMIIGTKKIYDEMGISGNGLLKDMSEIYPDDPNADENGYKVSGTSFAEKLGYDGLSDDLYFSFRTPQKLMGTSEKEMEENYYAALSAFDRYLAENHAKAS